MHLRPFFKEILLGGLGPGHWRGCPFLKKRLDPQFPQTVEASSFRGIAREVDLTADESSITTRCHALARMHHAPQKEYQALHADL